MDFNLEKYRQPVAEDLLKQVHSVNNCEFPELIALQGFHVANPEFKKTAKKIRTHFSLPAEGDQVIYIFTIHCDKMDSGTLQLIVDAASTVIEADGQGYTQITGINNINFNHRLENVTNEVVLYVGTSGDISQRLREHVGYGSKGTATIFLKEWPDFINSNVDLRFQYYNFGPNFPTEALKMIEHRLSYDLKPILGRNRKA